MSSLPKFAAAAALVTAGLLSALPQAARAERIDCPLAQVRREVTTTLPSGWWTTPIVNSLTEARVASVAGRTALQCIYGPAGSIQRYAPDGATCRVSGRSFDCQVARAGARTFSTGPIDIPQTYAADLDRGGVGSGAQADIWFQAETADLLYLVPRGGARIGVGDRSNRGFAGCSGARFTTERVSLRDIPAGSYVCVRTGEGRISQFRVNAVSGGSPRTLSIGYTTWE